MTTDTKDAPHPCKARSPQDLVDYCQERIDALHLPDGSVDEFELVHAPHFFYDVWLAMDRMTDGDERPPRPRWVRPDTFDDFARRYRTDGKGDKSPGNGVDELMIREVCRVVFGWAKPQPPPSLPKQRFDFEQNYWASRPEQAKNKRKYAKVMRAAYVEKNPNDAAVTADDFKNARRKMK